MMFIIYDKNTYKINSVIAALKKEDINIEENELILDNENIKDFSQKDIRAYNKDGSVKSLEEQLKEKIITLKDNEIIDNGIIRELNKNHEDDYIIMIERGIEELDKSKKIITNEDGKKYITEKSFEEKYKDGLINNEEYNSYIISQRSGAYSQNIDGVRAELLDNVLDSLKEKGLLNENQISKLDSIKNTRADIKNKYKKIL
ncbi:hypothetical protein [Brachyspira pilosicoli]